MPETADHLHLHELFLPPGAEWPIPARGWQLICFTRGAGYLLGMQRTEELGAGDVVIAGPGASGAVRASLIGPVRVHHFQFAAELLPGLLTLPERNQLELLARSPGWRIHLVPATDKIAAEFHTLVECADLSNGLMQRCRNLMFVAMLFAPQMNLLAESTPPQFTARRRFSELVRRLPEAELLQYPPAELARLCGCTVPRLVRLFRLQFGESLRARQARFRLESARRMLLETRLSIREVAGATGFRTRRSFNDSFRKQFGLTASQLRGDRQEPTDPAIVTGSRGRPS